MAVTTKGFTSVGTDFLLSAAKPTSQTGPLYAGLTWTTIGEVDSIGDIVVTDEIQSRVPLKTGVTTKTKGATNYEPFDISGAWASGDAGQVMLKAAKESKATYSYQIAYADGSKEYGECLVTSRGKMVGDSSAFTGFMTSIEPTGASLEVPMV